MIKCNRRESALNKAPSYQRIVTSQKQVLHVIRYTLYKVVPILLVSRDKRQTNKFVRDYIKEHSFDAARVIKVEPEKTVISIDQIRNIKSMLTRVESKKRMIVVYAFETARPETQNAFLKTLEEKTAMTQFIVVVADQSQMLPTIVSRCRVVRLASKVKPKDDLAFDFSSPLPKLLGEFSDIKKAKAVKLCDDLLWYFKHELQQSSGMSSKKNGAATAAILKEVLTTRNLILRNNLNPQMAIDHLLMYIKGV